jgi:hypothetical protein
MGYRILRASEQNPPIKVVIKLKAKGKINDQVFSTQGLLALGQRDQ